MCNGLLHILLLSLLPTLALSQTYAERLGYHKGTKVVILHVDDVGMSYESNAGAIKALEEGVASSVSVMMPCGWVPGFVRYLKAHPTVDAGLHLTLTSEWRDYRWGPLAGKPAVPGLVDAEGSLWPTVPDVVQHASAAEVAREIRSQLERARTMGFQPTHLDTHMGTLFATPEFLTAYLTLGMQEKIPVLFPGGHSTLITQQMGNTSISPAQAAAIGAQLWAAGLPVLDDIHTLSYGFPYPKDKRLSDKQLQKMATDFYLRSFADLQPGITMVIMHCSIHSDVFPHITDSGVIRRGDLLAMLSPRLRRYLAEQNIVVTTWQELTRRRIAVQGK